MPSVSCRPRSPRPAASALAKRSGSPAHPHPIVLSHNLTSPEHLAISLDIMALKPKRATFTIPYRILTNITIDNPNNFKKKTFPQKQTPSPNLHSLPSIDAVFECLIQHLHGPRLYFTAVVWKHHLEIALNPANSTAESEIAQSFG